MGDVCVYEHHSLTHSRGNEWKMSAMARVVVMLMQVLAITVNSALVTLQQQQQQQQHGSSFSRCMTYKKIN